MWTVINRHNFIFLLLVAEILYWAVGKLLKCLGGRWHNSRRGGNFLLPSGVIRFPNWLRLSWIIGATILVCCIASAAYAIQFKWEECIYIHTETEKQKSADILFEEEQTTSGTEEEDQGPRDVLHIPEFYLGKDVVLERVQYFEAVLGSVYQQGDQTQYTKTTLPTDAVYDSCENTYITEAKYYREAYNGYSSRENHYQYGRSLTDAGMTVDGVSFAHRLAMMDDSVSTLEKLTVYREWNANTEEDPTLINSCFLAFSNGKLFLHNAPLAAGSEEGKNYVSWFYVEAYICFCQGKERIVEQGEEDKNKLYALLCYYIGDAGENLLERIDKEKESTLYNQVYSTALENYREAKRRYENNSIGYKEEPGIMVRIENGVTTLEGMTIPKV